MTGLRRYTNQARRRSGRTRAAPLLLAFLIVSSACFEEAAPVPGPPEDPTDCTIDTAFPPHDYIGIRNPSIEPTAPVAGAGFTIRWDRTATFFQTEESLGYHLRPDNAFLGITLEGDADGLPIATTLPFNYSFPDFPETEVVPVLETLDIETLLPTALTDLTIGAYTLRLDLAGTDHQLCPPAGSSQSLILDFSIGEEGNCGFNDVDQLDLVVSDLAYDPAPPRTVSWNVAYNIESPDGSTPPGAADTTQTVTIVEPTTNSELASITINNTGEDGLLAGDSYVESRTLNDFGISGQDIGNQMIIRVEITTTTPNAECGADNLDLNNATELLTTVQ